MKKLALFLALLMVFSLFTACGGTDTTDASSDTADITDTVDSDDTADTDVFVDSIDIPNSEQYTLSCGASLYAEKGMTEVDQSTFTAMLQSDSVIVMMLAEEKALMPAGSTLDDYAAIIHQTNNLANAFSTDSCGNRYTTNIRNVDGTNFFYYVTVKENNDAFWLIQVACTEADRAHYEPLAAQWLATVQLPKTLSEAERKVSARSFDLDCGLTITMPDNMSEFMYDGFTEFYSNNELSMVLLVEDKYEGYTLDDYCEALADVNGTDPFTLSEYGVPFTYYIGETQGMTYHYYLTAYEFSDSFVLCQFFCLDPLHDKYESLIPAWAASLRE